jgi:hypothetical protein
MMNTFGAEREKYDQVFFNEVKKQFLNRDGPGPGRYYNENEVSVHSSLVS